MQATFNNAHADPMMEINTPPLSDVMFVLLIMLIITIPIQTHAIKLDLPTGTPPQLQPNPVSNLLAITPTGNVTWNGKALTREALRQELRLTQQIDPVPELHIKPDATARYG